MIIIQSNVDFTNPLPGTPVAPPRTLNSDSFNRANTSDIVGSKSDAALGGVGGVWEGTGAGVGISNQKMVRGGGTGSFTALQRVHEPNYEVSVKVESGATGGTTIYLVGRQSGTGTDTSVNWYGLWFGAASCTLRKRSGGTLAALSSSITFALGSRVGLRMIGNQIHVVVNDQVVFTVTDDSISTPGYAGITGSGSSAGFILDDFVVNAV